MKLITADEARNIAEKYNSKDIESIDSNMVKNERFLNFVSSKIISMATSGMYSQALRISVADKEPMEYIIHKLGEYGYDVKTNIDGIFYELHISWKELEE